MRPSLLFRPAEVRESLGDAGQWEADDIEVVAFDAWDIAAGAALDGVGACFVVRLFGGKVACNFRGVERCKVDESGFDELEAFRVGQADERDAGEHGMGAAGELFEHLTGVVRGAGLAKDAFVESNDGVSGDNDGGADGAGGDEFGFGVSEALDEITWGFAGEGSFVHGGRHDDERKAGVVKNFGASGRGGGENEFHKGSEQ
jgi:hypothetical protein